ncbi:hypothetical protein [Spiroplasma endosymbiont of Phyllotreta cruciferae]|uniref:hypothetical protein n=1 Tax=Spiroplasma endosymbiont of Phyllotreta cruciferae TaxID=2886375 RepID=UPI00209F801D|nr:hypothetical protein [Spiroplasma endosymbiont of Phyllotreta cruciferae]
MKKLLSLLSVLTISGTTVPTTIAASPYQKDEKLNRNNNLENKSFEELMSTDIKIEELISIVNLNVDLDLKFDLSKKEKFSNLGDNIQFKDGWWTVDDIEVYTFNIGKNEPKDYSKIFSLSAENSFTKISWYSRIVENGVSINDFFKKNNFKDLIILNNKVNNYSQAIENIKYTLQDFYFKENGRKNSFPYTYFNELKASVRIGFTYFWENGNCYFQFLKLENKSKKISSESTFFPNPIVSLGSGFKLSESENSNISRLKDWLYNFNIWREEIKRQKKQSFSSYSEIQKKDWKGNKFNELLEKIDSLKDKIEISKLSSNFNQLKSDFNSLKDQLIKLKEQINNSNSSWNCANITAFSGGATSLIPVAGTFLSAMFTIISAGCAIANV